MPAPAMTEPRKLGPSLTGSARRAHLARRALAAEASNWRSIWRFVARRPQVPEGATAFSYDKPIRMVLIVLLALSAVEVPIVDLLTHQWPAVRYPLLALGIWGVATMLGMLFGYLTRPHAVGPGGIRMRSGGEVDVDLPWDVIASVERRRHALTGAPTLSISDDGDDQVLNHVMQDFADILITLEGPTVLELPQETVTVTALRISVDDPAAFLDAVRSHMP